MAVEKLSISMDATLIKQIREAAADEGVPVSTWLAEAAVERARQHALREAVREDSREHGALTADEIDRLVTKARVRSVVSHPRKRK